MRSHAPFGAVHRFAPFAVEVFLMPHTHIVHVFVVGESRINFHGGIIFPFVWITDFHGECVELFDGIELGVVAHPVKMENMLAKGCAKILYQSYHVLFA